MREVEPLDQKNEPGVEGNESPVKNEEVKKELNPEGEEQV